MLRREHVRVFQDRNKLQTKNIRKSLNGRWQKVFQEPARQHRFLRAKSRSLLVYGNAYSHNRWMRMLGGQLAKAVGASAPDYLPTIPVYFLTLTFRDQNRTLGDYLEWLQERVAEAKKGNYRPRKLLKKWDISIQNICYHYRHHVAGSDLNLIGMVEPGMYVSAWRSFDFNTIFHFHFHALVWGVPESKIQEFCQHIRKHHQALIPNATPAQFEEVRAGDLLQVIWYITKAPNKQYQPYLRPSTGNRTSIKQWDRPINGVNSVRLYKELKGTTFSQLTIGVGEGAKIEEALRSDVFTWRNTELLAGNIRPRDVKRWPV